ncbi:MAG: type II toxin-antitoxin system HicA family toxin [Dehalococcoidia bacterium]
MQRFPSDAPKQRVIKALESLGFQLRSEREHIAMIRSNPDGSSTALTIPNHDRLKASTLRTVCTRSGISRIDFLTAYDKT